MYNNTGPILYELKLFSVFCCFEICGPLVCLHGIEDVGLVLY